MTEAIFGKYRLIAELGSGGMADVFLAVDVGPAGLGFSKLLVIKRLKPGLIDDPDFVGMLVDEARIAARLNHPNVVQTNEIGNVGPNYFIAMEYLEGQPLSRIISRARKTNFQLRIILRIVADALAGLHHAHELVDFDGTPLGVVHRDVSPHNVFVTYEGQVKVVDFGIAKALGRTAETRTGMLKGKVRYMAPEQAVGVNLDRRADVFSVGVILWETLTGKRFWANLDDVTVISRLISGQYDPSPRSAAPDVPEKLDAIVAKAVAFEPAKRFANAQQLQAEIEAYLADNEAPFGRNELSAFVSDLFEDRRREMKQVIEAQLVALSKGTVDMTKVRATISTTLTPASSSNPAVAVATTAQGAAITDLPVEENSATIAMSTATKFKIGRRRNRTRVVIFCAGAVLVGALAALSLRHKDSGEPASPAPAAPEIARVHVSIRATPTDARLTLDGKPIENPFSANLPKDDAKHALAIEAPGFTAAKRDIALDQDTAVEVALDRIESPRPEPAGSSESPKTKHNNAPQPQQPPAKPVGPKPKYQIDQSDPWNQ